MIPQHRADQVRGVSAVFHTAVGVEESCNAQRAVPARVASVIVVRDEAFPLLHIFMSVQTDVPEPVPDLITPLLVS